MQDAKPLELTRKDFLSSIEAKWCVGCGCYATYSALTRVFPTLGIPREKYALISGIGCSSRLPYYVNTYGFHTIHGRAPTVAMGLKLANPELSVWVITGDGDALSIGGNHFMHLMRRNPDIKVILFNNQIYGLTKGQASPTTAFGKQTKSTPFGNVDHPVLPLSMAIASGATFAARVPDTEGELLTEVLTAAAKHRGVAFIEVLINCVIFNDGVYSHLTNKETKADTTVRLKHGQPLLFGKDNDKAVCLNGFRPEVMKIAPGQNLPDNVVVHDAGHEDSATAFLLSQMEGPNLPVPVGIFRQVERPVHGDSVEELVAKDDGAEYDKVLRGRTFWTV